MKKILYINGEYSGELGKPVFKDSLGKQLCVGDTVLTVGDGSHKSINIVADNYIYGWATTTEGGDLTKVFACKIINYTQLEKLKDKIEKFSNSGIKVKKNRLKEMTIAEIEKELGYSIKIIKD